MMEARQMGRLYTKVINNVAGSIADYNLKSMKLSSASALSSFEYVSRLTGSRTALEMISSVRVPIIEINLTYWAAMLTISSISPPRRERCGRTPQWQAELSTCALPPQWLQRI
jgi:hypothetical protein